MRRFFLPLFFLFLSFPLFAQTPAEQDLGSPMTLEEAQQGTLLLRTTEPGVFLPAPTLETRVTIDVAGFIARARVRQRFHNPTDAWVEGIYVFPLPENAAVDQLRMLVGEREVVGEIREREEARKVYEQAKREGKKATLVSQERPNVFTTEVANLGPGEDVEVEIEYQEDLRYDTGAFYLRFPLVVAPRYVPGGTDQVSAASRITPPLATPESERLNPVHLEVTIDAGMPLARIESRSHEVIVDTPAPGRYHVELAHDLVPADRDFVLEWESEPGTEPQTALFTQEVDGELYHLLMVLPPHGGEAETARLARETIFVIDTSGSMAGTSIVQAREALLHGLDYLQPGDFFNVIEFNSYPRRLFDASRPADPEPLAIARRWISALEARDGTEIRGALELALADQAEARGVRQVIFATDASVGNEDELLRYIADHLGESRLFTIGIGSAPNSYFLREAARLGRGTFTFIGDVNEVAKKMNELFVKLESPVLHDVDVRWDDPTIETFPDPVGDLYLGQPIVVIARAPDAGSGVVVSGWRGEQRWEVSREAGGKDAVGLDKLWAHKKISALMDQRLRGVAEEDVRRQVLEVALGHHLVSKYTSLVAIDLEPSAPAGIVPQTQLLPVSLPAGWSPAHAFGGGGQTLPRTGTASAIQVVIGLLLIALALFLLSLGQEG